MPKKQDWEKSHRLTNDMRADIVSASIKFCFKPMMDIFEELHIVLAWDLYHAQINSKLLTLYEENIELMEPITIQSRTFVFANMPSIPDMDNEIYRPHIHKSTKFPIPLVKFSNPEARASTVHHLAEPPEGKNKKQKALHARHEMLRRDLKIFTTKISAFKKEIEEALRNVETTKQFIDRYPAYEGYMKQSLKKYYDKKYPDVMNALDTAMNVRQYASLTHGFRLQAYQQSMLEQLEQLDSPVRTIAQA